MTPGSVSAQSVMLPLVPMISIGSTLVDCFLWNLKPAAYADHPASFTSLTGTFGAVCSVLRECLLFKQKTNKGRGSQFLSCPCFVSVFSFVTVFHFCGFFFYDWEDIFHLSLSHCQVGNILLKPCVNGMEALCSRINEVFIWRICYVIWVSNLVLLSVNSSPIKRPTKEWSGSMYVDFSGMTHRIIE